MGWFINRVRVLREEPTAAPLLPVAHARIPAPSVGDRMAFIPAQRDRRAHSSF